MWSIKKQIEISNLKVIKNTIEKGFSAQYSKCIQMNSLFNNTFLIHQDHDFYTSDTDKDQMGIEGSEYLKYTNCSSSVL